ncbi:MAG: methyltransferase [Chloroflexi bacterium]|nr:methyltransferase [Chloroflexota bacterium]
MTQRQWKADLERDGFVHLPQVLGAEEVDRLATLALQSVSDYATSEDLIRTEGGTPLKLLYPLSKYQDFLSVLGRKELGEIVDSLLPRTDSVLTWEDVLIKMPFVGAEVGPHQDIGLDPVRYSVHSLGISLHHDGDNPVYFLPGSHRLGPLTATAVSAIGRECEDRFRPVVTRPGDIVVHNVHVLHYSDPNLSQHPRATWYLEFRSMLELLEKGPWTPDWVHRRRAIWVQARASAGVDTSQDEPDEVKDHLEGLRGDISAFRVPHTTDTVQYDRTSPYNHFAFGTEDWRGSRPAPEGTHHLKADDSPLYRARFQEVLKFHAPGLAPVQDLSAGYHITPDGQPAYQSRYLRTFGFYEDLAAVHSRTGWFHILPDGRALYPERYAWCGNFQEDRCPVRLPDGRYFHLTAQGVPAYGERYRYAGDYRDGIAVVQREDGKHTHVDRSGNLVHGRWFLDLDVFHKNRARACDAQGWHHVGMEGEPLYAERFRNVEPFYNGQARVERFDGSLLVIDESGGVLLELRKPQRSQLEELSAQMVGLWKTGTIHAAVKLGVFEALPASAPDIEAKLQLGKGLGVRLLRGLTELGLAKPDGDGLYHPTVQGSCLSRSHPTSLADAALHWGGEVYSAWNDATRSLKTGQSGFTHSYGSNLFDWLRDRPERLQSYQAAMAAYARHDYQYLAETVDFSVHDAILDVGGGAGELAFTLLRAHPRLTVTVMDLPEVIEGIVAPADVAAGCRLVAGDFFCQWPITADAVVLARVLHDWPDADAERILKRARQALSPGGTLYLVEMVLDESSGNGGLLDLHMLVMLQGMERTRGQFRDLLAAAGFVLLDVSETGSVSSIIRARAV